MLAKIGQDVTFVAFFTESQIGKTGLTVTVDVYDPADTKIKNGVSATAIGGGLYKYTLAAADFDAIGNYTAIFKTATDTVDVMHVPAMWTGVGSIQVDEDAGTGTLDDTLTGMLRMLRLRLNDKDSKNYTTEELVYCVNLAYRESVVSSCCHKERKEVTLVDGTHTYDISPIFEPIAVYKSTTDLPKKNIKDIAVELPSWDSTTKGTPTSWMHITGSSVRFYPTPGATPGTAIVYGYAYPTVLDDGADRPTALPDAYSVQAILDRAEAEACKMRRTTANNLAVYERLMNSWKEWCVNTRLVVRGKE